jgi:hypothetical protein
VPPTAYDAVGTDAEDEVDPDRTMPPSAGGRSAGGPI